MAKKKKREEGYLADIFMRGYLQSITSQYRQGQPVEDSLLEKEEASRCQEQQFIRQRDSDLAYMAIQFQEFRRELRKMKKSMNNMEVYMNVLEDNSHKLEKKLRGLSEKFDKLHQRTYKQKEELKKYHSQIHLQKKVIRLMGTYFGINNPSDNLERILNKFSKKLDSGYMQISRKMKVPEIIEGEYREV